MLELIIFCKTKKQQQFMSGNTASAEVSIPSLVTSEECHGQSFSSVVIMNKTWRQGKNQVIKHAGVNFSKNN